MSIFKYAALSFRIAYYRWALQHLCPSHSDVPAITVHVMYLEEKRDQVAANWSRA